MNTLQTPPTVTRVVEADDYHVAVELHPLDVLPELLTALGSSALLLGQVARYRASNAPDNRAEALRIIASSPAVQRALTLRLDGGTAEDLSAALDDNCTRPDPCRRCANLAEIDGLCAGHHEAVECNLRLVP